MTAARARAIAIGASAGAVQALSDLLPELPAVFSAPIFIVVHVPPDRDSVLAELLQAKCALTVKEAEDKETVEGGVVYLAPPDYHLLVEANGSIALSSDEPVNYSRPAIDVLFESAADAYGEGLLGIILTGANHDGAAGLKAVADAGGAVIVEDPETAQSKAMPLAAAEACPGAEKMSLRAIATHLSSMEAA